MKAALLLLPIMLMGCDLSMRRQPRYDVESRADLWSDGMAARPTPEGVVATDQPQLDQADAAPPPVSLGLLQHGRATFQIYCTPCHGEAGAGDGKVVQRGFPKPPDLAEAKIRQADARHLYEVITRGYGVMYPFADKIDPADRWAVVAYLRVLQTARAGG
jgi:mono/diheme cytochrome c family protein